MIRKLRINAIRLCVFAMLAVRVGGSAVQAVDRFDVFEAEFTSVGKYENPYVELEAEAALQRPDGSTWTLPLFWDGDNRWKLRVSPNLVGDWSFTIQSQDKGLDGKTGSFTCDESALSGSIEPMEDFPLHFQYQNGQPMWFLGDTAWALFTDSTEEKHDRAAAEKYLRTRAALRVFQDGRIVVDEIRSPSDDFAESFYLLQRQFADCLLAGSAPPQPATDNLRTLRATLAAYDAAQTKLTITS
jgi:hypothetical protein